MHLRRPEFPRPKSSLAVRAAVTFALAAEATAPIACGSSHDVVATLDDGGFFTEDGAAFAMADGGDCRTNAPGCRCPAVGATVACWSGPPASRGANGCSDGTQTCQRSGEFLVWGPCAGEVRACVPPEVPEAGPPGSVPDRGPGGECGALATTTMATCGVFSGRVRCLGRNDYGELGNGTTVNSTLAAVEVPNLGDARCIAGGEDAFYVLTNGGAVKWWGKRLDPAHSPENSTMVSVDVPGLQTGVVGLAAGEQHACARMDDGAVKCWGQPGEIDRQPTIGTTPTEVPGLGPGVKEVVAGDGFSCALMATGGIKCWGGNRYGELGNGTTTSSDTAVDVIGLPTGAVAVSAAAASQACALLQDGRVFCWGNSFDPPKPSPVEVSGFSAKVVAISTGFEFSGGCALLSTGAVQCWGIAFGDAGIDWMHGGPVVDAPGLGAHVVEVRSSDFTTCVRLDSGGVQCLGQIFGGLMRDAVSPTNIPF